MNGVNLDTVLRKGRASVVSGRSDGAHARSALKLNEIEKAGTQIRLLVPEYLTELTPSFVLGLFSETFRRLSTGTPDFEQIRDKFFSLYFVEGSAGIKQDIEDGIADFVDVERSLSAFSNLKH
jgi:hypothetical protein